MSKSSPQPLSTAPQPAPARQAEARDADPKATQRSSRSWSTAIAFWTRWLHIYLSMLGLAATLFFSVTGLTLNHPDWFVSESPQVVESRGTIPGDWITAGREAESIDRLRVVELLRSRHAIRGALADFTIDDSQCVVAFKGPGYTADVFFDRENGSYQLTEARMGTVALLNDLHKGRDSGKAWSAIIDFSAILLVLISVTGLVLLFYVKRRRATGLVLALAGTAAVVLTFWWLVP